MAGASTWFYMNGPERVGPVSQFQLCDLFRKGMLGLETLVWSDAFKNWTPASRIAALRSLIPATPLPMPPLASSDFAASNFAPAPVSLSPLTASHMARPVMEYETPAVDGPVGIGGWLILPAIGMILNPIGIALGVIGLWAISAKIEANGANGAAGSLRMIAGLNALFGLYLVYTAINFFSKRRAAPALAVGAYVGSILLAVISTMMLQSFPQATAATAAPPGVVWLSVVKPVLIAFIWIPYFRMSRRVQNTFVN
jgi:hypothetical protein